MVPCVLVKQGLTDLQIYIMECNFYNQLMQRILADHLNFWYLLGVGLLSDRCYLKKIDTPMVSKSDVPHGLKGFRVACRGLLWQCHHTEESSHLLHREHIIIFFASWCPLTRFCLVLSSVLSEISAISLVLSVSSNETGAPCQIHMLVRSLQ